MYLEAYGNIVKKYRLEIMLETLLILSVNQYLCHNLGYQQKIPAIQRNQAYFSSSNVSTDTTVIVKD